MSTKLRVEEMREVPQPEQRKRIIRKAIVEIVIYSIYLITTLLLAIASRDETMFCFHEVMNKHFLEESQVSSSDKSHAYYDIVTRNEWWTYIEDVFLESLHENKSSTEPTRYILEENLLMGPPRFRQKRVRSGTCRVRDHFSDYFKECFGLFTTENEERAAEYKGTKYVEPTSYDVLHMGQFTHLTDGGYVKELTYDEEKNKEIIKKLKEDEWFDRATRLIVLEFVCFNDNTKLFNNFKLAAEMPAIGGLLTEIHHEVIDLYTFWTKPNNYFVWITCALFYGCLLYYIYEETRELMHLRWRYFCSFWNYLDLGVMILCWLCAMYHFWHAWYIRELIKEFLANPDKYLNIDKLAYVHSIYMNTFAMCVFLQCFRCFKYFNFNTTLLQFITTLKRCSKDILGFCFMFIIIFLAYALVGFLMFCTYHREFKDIRNSMLTMIKMIVGQFDYDKLEETNHLVGPVYFVSYILVVFFILMNMFLAILADTYLNVKQEIRTGELDLSSFLTKSFKQSLIKLINRMCRRQRKPMDGLIRQGADGENVLGMRESEILRNYFELIGPQANTDLNSQQQREIVSQIKSLQQRLLVVEISMEELILKLDILLDETEANKKHVKKKKK